MKSATRNRLQVRAFQSFYRSHLLDGMPKEMAFAGAIEKSCDDVFERIIRDPGKLSALRSWLKTYARTDTTGL